jgi:spore coat protein U-like protein
MNPMRSRLAWALCAMFVAGAAMADTATINVTASIEETCSVGNGGTIALGTLSMIDDDGAQTTDDSVTSSTFSAICTNGTAAPKFAYSSGNEDGGNFRLIGATDDDVFITYTLHQDSTATEGAVTHAAENDHPDFTANGVSQDLPLSVKVAPSAKAGKLAQSYSDTITITVSF